MRKEILQNRQAEGYHIIEEKHDTLLLQGEEIADHLFPIAVFAPKAHLSGTFAGEVYFYGRLLSLEDSTKIPVLEVRCATVKGPREGLDELKGAYQYLKK